MPYSIGMSIVELYGHEKLKNQILKAGLPPSSLLLHGLKGVGKQRLALDLAQAVLCDADMASRSNAESCGVCAQCRAVKRLQHPDLHWIFPSARLKKPDPTSAEIFQDYAEQIADRVGNFGLYSPPSGSEGIYVYTIKAVVSKAALGAAMASRKVFIIGDAERMVPQEGADEAANAFLKLLEEPPADTFIILTSSQPGSLLPTVLSRVVAYRCLPLPDKDVESFVSNEKVHAHLEKIGLNQRSSELVELAAGSPGNLLGAQTLSAALKAARDLVDAAEASASGDTHLGYEIALRQGVAGARGGFSDMLRALNIVFHERAKAALAAGNTRKALRNAKGIKIVSEAQSQAERNVNPQLITAKIIRDYIKN